MHLRDMRHAHAVYHNVAFMWQRPIKRRVQQEQMRFMTVLCQLTGNGQPSPMWRGVI
jgi:hypothetical protein